MLLRDVESVATGDSLIDVDGLIKLASLQHMTQVTIPLLPSLFRLYQTCSKYSEDL